MLRGLARMMIQGPGILPGLLRLSLCAGCILLCLAAPPARAEQTASTPVPVLTLDFERLFDNTLWGKRIVADMARDSAALNAENTRIADDLIAEEKSLTDRRSKLSIDDLLGDPTQRAH